MGLTNDWYCCCQIRIVVASWLFEYSFIVVILSAKAICILVNRSWTMMYCVSKLLQSIELPTHLRWWISESADNAKIRDAYNGLSECRTIGQKQRSHQEVSFALEYFLSASFGVREVWATAHSCPSVTWQRRASKPVSDLSHSTIIGLVGLKIVNIDTESNRIFRASKARSCLVTKSKRDRYFSK